MPRPFFLALVVVLQSCTARRAESEVTAQGGDATCTSCHGLPPGAPHPQIDDCSHCHAAVVKPDNTTIIDSGLHMDGKVEFAFDEGCSACHGSENPAPPLDLEGRSDTTSLGVGAHQTHVNGTARSRAVPCGECHLVPTAVLDVGHIDTPRPAEVTFSGAALAFVANPSYAGGRCQNTACHGGRGNLANRSGATNPEPIWNAVDGTQAVCGSCHGLPPPPPHPSGQLVCNGCHKDVEPDNATFFRPDLHADGVVTFTFSQAG